MPGDRVQRIWQSAIAIEPGLRTAFVRGACEGDERLFAEVESLLAADAAAADFLESPVWEHELPSGAVIAHYRVIEKLGAGGMGAVYRAEDLRLGRVVALKLILADIAHEINALERFQRESRAISALNHPHICVLYDIAMHQGRPVLVMEFLEGKTLAERLRQGHLPLDEVLEIGEDIAGALDAAHKHGIIHRDLKPSNVMLTPTGAKLLDFGLAKLEVQGTGEESSLTRSGTILGTVPYMAPEQLQGGVVDARTDLWALGVLLYEMIAGKPAFDAPSQAGLIAAILEREPIPLRSLQPSIPALLEHLVSRCLAKNPEGRWESARDVADQLRWLREGGVETNLHLGVRRIRAWKGISVLTASIAVVASLAVAVVARPWLTQPALPHSMRLTLALPEDAPLAPPGLVSRGHDRPALALSPDGTRLAYVALTSGKTQICLRDMATSRITSVPGTEGANTPFFSPDGNSIGFFADAKLKRASLAGDTPAVLADAPYPWGATWGSDDFIYFNRYEAEGVYKIPASGGSVQPVLKAGLSFTFLPELLRSGPAPKILVTSGRAIEFYDSVHPQKTIISGFGARYLPSGHLVYALQGKLMAVPFDRSRAEIGGSPVALADDLRTAFFGVAQFAVARNGLLVYALGGSQLMTSFVWVDRKGNSRDVGLPEALQSPFALSPDGRRLAFTVEDDNGDTGSEIWVYEMIPGRKSRITPRATSGPPAWNRYPRWTPDGRCILFHRQQGSQSQLIMAPVDGGGKETVVWSSKPPGPPRLVPMSFSPDGSVLSAYAPDPERSFELWLLPMADPGESQAREPKLFLGSPFAESAGTISPDGRWMLYCSDKSGRYESYVTSYPKPGAVQQISKNGGQEPRWNPNGKEIVYFDSSRMYAVDVTLTPEFKIGETHLLFEGPFPDLPGVSYDIAPDGQHFLMLQKRDFFKPSTTLQVITNVSDELQRHAAKR